MAAIVGSCALASAAHAAPAPVKGTWAVPGATGATISWEPSAGATSYKVYESTTSGVLGALVGTVGATETTLPRTGLVNGTLYYYTVHAVDGVGESGDPVETIETIGTMAVGRFSSQCNAVSNGSIYMFAVFNAAATTEIWKFDATTGVAAVQAEVMPAADMDCAASARGGTIQLLGGGTNYTATTNQVKRYTPGANPVVRASTLPSARFEMPGLTLGDGLVYAFGGRASGTSFNTVLQYDAIVDTNPVAATTFAAGRAEASASAVDGSAIIAGGYRCNNGLCTAKSWLTEVYRYDYGTNTLTARAALPVARSGAGMASLNDRSYLFGGNTNGSGGVSNVIYQFDDRGNAWAPLGTTLPVASAYHATKRIRGFIYLVGGYTGATLNTIQRFSPGGQARVVPNAPVAATAPTALVGTPGAAQVSLAWTAGANVMYNRVFRSTTSGQRGVLVEEQRGMVDEPGVALVDAGLADGTYYYTVTGVGFDERETAATSQVTVVVGAGGAPANTVLPSISGTTTQGQVLTAAAGTWTGSPTGYAYQWRRCTSPTDLATCSDIAGATVSTLTLTQADVDAYIRIVVTATNASGSMSATSTTTAQIAGLAPTNTALPTFSGTHGEGDLLTGTSGSWSGTTPITLAYQWVRCDTLGNGCVAIAGATSITYTIVLADVGSTLRLRVSATNTCAIGCGSTSADSTQSAIAASLSISLAGYNAGGAGPFTGPATSDLGLVTAGVPVASEVRVTVATSNAAGYTLGASDPDGGGGLDAGGTPLPWLGVGSAAAPAPWVGTGIAISMFGGSQTPDRWCVGGQVACTSTTDPDLMWSPLLASTELVSGRSSSTAGDTTRVPIRTVTGTGQLAGAYSGALTFTAIVVP